MGPPSYMRSVVDRNVVMLRIPVFIEFLCIQHIMVHGTSGMRRIRSPYNAQRTTIRG